MGNPVETAVRSCPLYRSGDRVLVAASGGADSMSLLAALGAQANSLGVSVVAAHFDHRLRAGSGRDGDLVASFCAARGIELCRGRGDVPARARRRRESQETAARDMRYAFLESAAGRVGANRIATAHTRDDQVETVLMRVLRGAGIRGLAGIPRRRGTIVRPLLDVARADTRAFCRRRGVPFADDPTNAQTRFARNWIRHVLLPAVRERSGDIDADLVRLGSNAAQALARIRSHTDPVLDSALEHDGRDWILDTRALRDLDDVSRYVLLADLLAHRAPAGCDVGRVHLERLIAMTRAGAHSGRMASLPGCCARREHHSLVFFPGSQPPGAPGGDDVPRALPVPGSVRFGRHTLTADVLSRAAVDRDHFRLAAQSCGGVVPCVAYFARDSLTAPLLVRSPRRGDRMQPFGMRGHRKLSDVFIDRKIPARRRPRSLVVEDGREIVWVVGVTTSESTRVSDDATDVVRITVSGE